MRWKHCLGAIAATLMPSMVLTSTQAIENLHWTRETIGIVSVVVFAISYPGKERGDDQADDSDLEHVDPY